MGREPTVLFAGRGMAAARPAENRRRLVLAWENSPYA